MKRRRSQVWLVVAVAVLVAAGIAWAGGRRQIIDILQVQTIAFNGPSNLTRGDEGAKTISLQPSLGITSGLGTYPMTQLLPSVAAAADDSIHGAISIPTGALTYTDVTTNITQPDVYRCVSIKPSATFVCAVTVSGTSWDGEARSDLITSLAGNTVAGLYPFKTVTSIRVWGVAVPGGASVKIGCSEKLGLYRPLAAAADVVGIDLKAAADTAWTVPANGALPAGATVDALYGTVDPETAITAGDGYVIRYNASAW
jgi:hypothetical protein